MRWCRGKNQIIDGHKVAPGDKIIAIASSGPHSNGYSLIRKIIEVSDADLSAPCGETTLADALMAPTEIYNKPLLALQREIKPHALAHITGGGLLENIPRVLPTDCSAILDKHTWELPPVFRWLAAAGGVAEEEMHRTFNCGIGMTVIVGPSKAEAALQLLSDQGLNCWELGTLPKATVSWSSLLEFEPRKADFDSHFGARLQHGGFPQS